jgi:hypothetical protein
MRPCWKELEAQRKYNHCLDVSGSKEKEKHLASPFLSCSIYQWLPLVELNQK